MLAAFLQSIMKPKPLASNTETVQYDHGVYPRGRTVEKSQGGRTGSRLPAKGVNV